MPELHLARKKRARLPICEKWGENAFEPEVSQHSTLCPSFAMSDTINFSGKKHSHRMQSKWSYKKQRSLAFAFVTQPEEIAQATLHK